jgi:hypothetical protein
LQLQPNICNNRPSFSSRRLCFLDYWLWGLKICPIVPKSVNDKTRKNKEKKEEKREK